MKNVVIPPTQVVRWEAAGGTWAIVNVGADFATVALRDCLGGETVEILTLTDGDALLWARTQA